MDLAEVLGKSIEKELIEAHKRGYAEGLEAAANMVERLDYNGDVHTQCDYETIECILRDEVERVRETGVNNENTQ